MSENFSRNDIFISEIVSCTLPSKNLKPKLQVPKISKNIPFENVRDYFSLVGNPYKQMFLLRNL